MLNWCSRFGISLFLDSNGYEDRYGTYECILGAGALRQITVDEGNAFEALRAFHENEKDWLFGHLCYDLKNTLEPLLHSKHAITHGYPSISFFVPEVVCFIERGTSVLQIACATIDPHEVFVQIKDQQLVPNLPLPALQFTPRITKDEYLKRVAALREHIRNGDCYEITFCNEAYAPSVQIEPAAVFSALNRASPAPFSAFYRLDHLSMMSATPERFIQKKGRVLRSQPIKGTTRRSANTKEDKALSTALRNSEKEQAENVMIVDLVRNDLARSCTVGTVHVDELFGIYTFPQVHQMISTISGQLTEDASFTDAISHAFPMGSMTGAPKHKVMQLIDDYEVARRELFSGSVGYITPDGDFDFNVIIRSLFYNAATNYLSYQTGGAITWDSDPLSEWEEMRLKASGIEGLFAPR
jgi:para-aminobenzoate synthetase component 1